MVFNLIDVRVLAKHQKGPFMKKLFLTTLALSSLNFSPFVSADKNIVRGEAEVERKYTGIYGGVHVGFSPSKLKIDHYENAARKWTKEKKASISTAMGGVHLGYQYKFSNCLVLGVEGFVDLRNIKKINKLPGGAMDRFERYESDVAYGAAFKMGLRIKDWTPYAKVGLDIANFEYHHNDKYFFKHHPAVPAKDGKPKKDAFDEYAYHVNKDSNNHKGLMLAVGVSYDLNARITVGAEFKHTQYNAKIYTPKPSTKDAPAVAYAKKVKPSVSSIMGTLTVRL